MDDRGVTSYRRNGSDSLTEETAQISCTEVSETISFTEAAETIFLTEAKAAIIYMADQEMIHTSLISVTAQIPSATARRQHVSFGSGISADMINSFTRTNMELILTNYIRRY